MSYIFWGRSIINREGDELLIGGGQVGGQYRLCVQETLTSPRFFLLTQEPCRRVDWRHAAN